MSDSSDLIKQNFESLCRKLNMDRETEEASWKKFVEVSKSYSLEGDQTHWICCALYSASRGSHTPTVGAQNAVVIGNCVSLNMLLRSCNISISHFFEKMRKWHEMANLSAPFLAQINRMETIYGITYHLFEPYNKIFGAIFLSPTNESSNNKNRMAAKCSYKKLNEFCWCLYLCAKNENPSYAEEIIHSLHLLICCIDFVYINVLHEKRMDLINPDFQGLPKNWNTPDFQINDLDSFCIIEPLCQLISAQVQDSLTMKKDLWRKIVMEFFSTKTLHGNAKTYMGVVSNENFDRNWRSLKSSYEQFVLSAGEIDERILLQNPNFMKQAKSTDQSESSKVFQKEMKSLNPDTPYLRRDILPRQDSSSEPVAISTENVRKLSEIAHITGPSEFITRIDPSLQDKLKEMLAELERKFHQAYPNKTESSYRFRLAVSLFFYLLDKIVRVEHKNKPNVDLKLMFANDNFATSLFICCVEVVLNAYNSHLKFPWILKDCFGFPAFYFSKIIEIVVRSHENILTRSLIKHLNWIEESCLESVIWKSDSPIWEQIEAYTKPLPSWNKVDINNLPRRRHPTQLQSPLNSACDTFNNTGPHESARRDLFNTSRRADVVEDNPTEQLRNNEVNRRAASLNIFFRKFYKLAWMRLEELCKVLKMTEESFLNLIWTIFEHVIIHSTDLMKDRNLDQIIMCAIYISLKVSLNEAIKFTDIMKSYRNQPQSTSEVYRNVLLEKDGENEQYGDLIQFYNEVFVPPLRAFANEFDANNQNMNRLRLSPHPTQNIMYPMKLDCNTPLTVHQMERKEYLNSPNQLSFSIGKSPAKDLEMFNEVIRRGKRSLPLDDDSYALDQKRCREHVPYDMQLIKGIIQDRK